MSEQLKPCILTVFGTTGDLMTRKVVPSLLYLWQRGLLPERFRVVGFGRREWDDERLRAHIRTILEGCCPEFLADEAAEEFIGRFTYRYGQFDDPAAFAGIASSVADIDREWDACSDKLFYLAVPPEHYATILRNLAASGATDACSMGEGYTRVLVEKPFGDDEPSSRDLDRLLTSLFREEQIYRIDHYLAKEMLQGILNFRFQNNLFEAGWDRRSIERIEINLLESIGVEKRGAFYDRIGALRDVGQNHLLQMLALITMEQPQHAGADAIRSARAAAIDELRPPTAREVAAGSFRAQYAGYGEIDGVAPDSRTETYFMLRTTLAGERWGGVPVTMQAGKRMGDAVKNVVVTFRRPPECMCDISVPVPQNRIEFSLEPKDAIRIDFWAKRPGFDDEGEPRSLDFFLYEREEKRQYVEEYARLLHDAIRGDQTLFVSSAEVEAGWRFVDPWIDGWEAADAAPAVYAPNNDAIVGVATAALRAAESSAPSARSVGVAGLGKMGAGLARNLRDHRWRVVGWNRHAEVATEIAEEGSGFEAVGSLERLAAALAPPRVIWLMVPAGAPVDNLLFGDDAAGETGGLAALLEPGDTVIDGGNSRWKDAAPRAARLAEQGIHYLDSGTSGGPAGARNGACLMIGGRRPVFEQWEPMFADVALPDGYRFFEGHGAGHFVKMVHNGIEYGMMQAIAEGFALMHEAPFALDLAEVADVYQHGSVVESRLVGWLGGAYEELGSDLDGASGVVGHTGEGAWTVEAAQEIGTPVPIIEGSLRFREESEKAPSYAGQVLTAMRNAFGGHGLGPGGGPRR
ncbi:MAG: glucose-6-phosphate dehydrogenase [Coriobacteriia bacterium]|nr:glucose-6-phosphate dehydrogenase [Coriobacteriia bacterium]